MFVFFSHIQLQSVPMQNGLIGLKAGAIGKNSETSKSAHLASGPAPWVSGSCLLGSCLLGSWFLRGEYSSHQCSALVE
jgi:hypothetical protein